MNERYLAIVFLVSFVGCFVIGGICIPLVGWNNEEEKERSKLLVKWWLIAAIVSAALAFLATKQLALTFIVGVLALAIAFVMGKAAIKLFQLFGPGSKEKPKNFETPDPDIIRLIDGDEVEVVDDDGVPPEGFSVGETA